MTNDDDQSLGGGETIAGGPKQRDRGSQSLSDEATFAGGMRRGGPQSLGDEATFGGGGAGGDDSLHDDDMEIVDLAARYVTEGVLGKGGMGEVLLATDTRLERKVAIKRILGDAAKSRTAVSRFLTEAKSIAALNHPNIVQIYDYGRATDGPFLIMEYVEGNSLLDKCREGAIPLDEAIDLTCQLCDGLGKAHDANIIHRDIKPANVLLTNDGIPKLTDFGLAKDETADSGLSVAGAVLGTLDFMPTEQRRDAALTDSRSDLWSLAATLYQMVTGKSPKIIKFKDVPQELENVLDKALEEQKDSRYQTATEFREALKSCLTTTLTSPVPVVDLGAGECGKCHARNDANRKFCQGCGDSLRVSCLSCEEQIPVWDKFCAECGSNQADVISARVAEYASQREQAEQDRIDYQFPSALELARGVAAIADERLAEHKPWAESFITETESEWERQQDSARQHFEEAQKHREASDYQSAVHTIEQIPEAMRTNSMSVYLQQLKSDRQESESLIETISDRVQRRELDGLLEHVQRAVELRGDRKDLQKLAQQLRDREEKYRQRRDESIRQAEELLSSGDAKGGLSVIQSVKLRNLRPSDVALQRRLEELVQAEDALSDLVQRCKADGILESDEVIEMYLAADGYLKLNPRHDKIGAMRDQLLSRMQKPRFPRTASPVLLSQLPANVLSRLPADVLSKLPADVLSKLPADVLSKLPAKVLSKLPADVLSKLPAKVLSKLPADVLSKLPADVLSKLPADVLSKLPADVLSKLPADVLSKLPAKVLSKLPADVLSKLPAKVLSKLPANVLSKLPANVLSKLPADVLSKLPADVLSKLPATVLPLVIKEMPVRKNSLGMAFQPLLGGTSTVGEGVDAHSVRLTQPFELGVYQVTQWQYERMMGTNPSRFKKRQNPVETVSWEDAVKFCRRLSELPDEKAAGYVYRLPTEAEWEYACRAGTTTKYSFGDSAAELGDYAWYLNNSDKTTHPVGQKKPNPWGLYDMHGNVYEWCQDWYGDYPSGIVENPTGPSSGSSRVLRGGSWGSDAANCRTANRHANAPAYRFTGHGFRLARSSVKSPP